ncbi:type I polyketide synthase [Paenibacillus caui]|uniref:type I polyketide synthase n=1 Tax=Paenibacillus caui TaxID=2873927 RepID=UPI001CA83CE5|nr:type I polyketide synthase [Paenibacillus caui]
MTDTLYHADNETDRTGFEIAVIGMAARFPGADNVTIYWENLKNGVESITHFTDEELEQAGVDPDLIRSPRYVKAKGFLEKTEWFDASFFGYTPREAELMEPQIRLYHEVAYEALENAGYASELYNGLIGNYAGAAVNHFWHRLPVLSDDAQANHTAWLLNDKDFLATRVSFNLNLTGPSYTVDTACSTSLVLIDLACKGLLTGGCDIALAGGISLSLPHKKGYLYTEGMINSPDGHCRPFDADAQGTLEGDGVGIVVLKRLEDAIADGDTIHAVIKGSATNNDGARKVDYTAPSVEGQAEVIKAAHYMAEVEPESIGYIEAHGTGTAIGDPIEIEGLKVAFDTKQIGFCRIGSAKSNLGHLNTAAGVAGFIKAVLTVRDGLIPPTLHYKAPNPKIDFTNSPFVINTALTPWTGATPRRAGVSSFGIGGTNAHVVLEEAPRDISSSPTGAAWLFLLSAKTATALEAMSADLAAYLRENPTLNLADAAYTLQVGRRTFAHKRAVVASNALDMAAALTDPLKSQTFHTKESGESPVVFLFSGQGSQYVNMARGLYEQEPVFRDALDSCFKLVRPYVDFDLKERFFPSVPSEQDALRLNQTEAAQVAIFAVEYALAQYLLSLGIRPQVMIGHSIGEFTAACLSGVISPEDTLKLVAWRGKLMQSMAPGAMTAVQLPEEDIRPLLSADLALAAVNSPGMCVVSGSFDAVDAFERTLQAAGHSSTRLHTSHAFHSPMMEPMLAQFEQKVREVTFHAPQIPYLSNVTGVEITEADVKDSRYWVRHLRETVRFSDGIGRLLTMEKAVFIELGAGNTLVTLLRKHPAKRSEHTVLNIIRHPQDAASDREHLLSKIGVLYAAGLRLEWSYLYGEQKRRRIPLPTYPFERQYFWKHAQELLDMQKNGQVIPLPGSTSKRKKLADWFYLPAWLQNPLVEETSEEPKTWLLLLDRGGLATRLTIELKSRGHEVFTAFSHDELTTHLQTVKPQKIVHAWTLDSLPNVQEAQERGFYSLLRLVKALDSSPLDIYVLSSGLHDVAGETAVEAGKATLLGLLKVIGQEYPFLKVRSVDVTVPMAGGWQERQLLDQLITEFTTKAFDPVVAYRGGQRLLQSFTPRRLDNQQNLPLRANGVYLLTGGFGGVGLALTECIAKSVGKGVKLVLLGRSAPSDEQLERIKQLQRHGAEILCLQADVANGAELASAIDQTEEHFGALHGVIHAAGITKGTSITAIDSITETEVETQFAPKVYGTLALEQALRGRELDFVVLTSSLSSILGGLGYAGYAAANAFLDTFAKQQSQLTPTRWISVAWDGWRIATKPQREVFTSDDLMMIAPDEGGDALGRILVQQGLTQVVVSTEELQPRLNRWVNFSDKDKKQETGVVFARPELTTSYLAPANQIEQQLCEIWQNYLGLGQVGVHDNFFELGTSSIDMVQISKQLPAVLGQEVPVLTLFKYSTIRALVDHLVTQNGTETVSEEENDWLDEQKKGRENRKRRRQAREVEFSE